MSRTAPQQLKLSEADLQASILALARMGGWLVHHDRPARTQKGWRTAIEGHAGYPDLTLARGGMAARVLWIEVKTAGAKLTEQQLDWARRLGSSGDESIDWHRALAGTGHYVVARPAHWHDGKLTQLLAVRSRAQYRA